MRDKVKRFLSILMTALMLVNLMPVGALAEGMKLDSNSVQSIGWWPWPEETWPDGSYKIYVYAKVLKGSVGGINVNKDGWYTLGYIDAQTMPSPIGTLGNLYGGGNAQGYDLGSLNAQSLIQSSAFHFEKNTNIPVRNTPIWSTDGAHGFKACSGATDYPETGNAPTWHLDILVNLKDVTPIHRLVFKVENSSGTQIGSKAIEGTWGQEITYEKGKDVPETITTKDGKIYELKRKNDNLGKTFKFDEVTKQIEFYYKYKGSVNHTLTINYVYEDGSEAAKSYQKTLPYQSYYSVTSPDITGYTADNPVVSGTMPADNVEVTVTYTKRTDLSYTVNYLEKVTNKVLHDQKVQGGMTFEDVVTSADEVIDIDGYNYDSVDKDTLTIGTSDNVINIYYTKKTGLSYTVNYLEKDTEKVLHDAKVQGGMTFEDVVTSADEVIDIDGYNYDSVDKDTLTIGTGENVINIYYTKKTGLSYTVNYLEKDTEKVLHDQKVQGGMTYEDTITSANEKIDISGYNYDSVDPETLTIQADESKNVINLYYTKKTDLSYTVNYLEKGTTNVLHEAKTVENQTFGAEITSASEKIDISGYNYDSASPETLTIQADESKNVINLYYTKQTNLSYKVNYLEQGTTNVLHEQKVQGEMTFDDVVKSEDEVIEINGYNYASADKETLTIGTGDNVINIYYTKRTDLSYTVNYLEKDTDKVLSPQKVKDGMTFGTVITSSDEVIKIDGYNYDSVDKDTLEIGTGDNVINIYYTKRTDLSYTVNYYWNGTTEKVADSKTEEHQTFEDVIIEAPKLIEGYTPISLERQELTITTDDNDNTITFYYYKNVKLTANSDTLPYNGEDQSVSGYTCAVEEKQKDGSVEYVPWTGEKPLTFEGVSASGSGKDVNKNGYRVEFNETPIGKNDGLYYVIESQTGTLTITPRAVTLTSETAGKTYDGTALEKPVVTVGGDGFVEGQVKEIKATGSVTNAGSVANTITFTPNKETFKEGNYAITKTEGTLTINKRSVRITSQSATKTYDGSALTRPAVTITGDGFVPGELAKAEATGSITNVGSTPNAIRYTTTGAFNAANYSIALSVGTLTVTEKPKPEPRRTFNLTINYVYQNGKRAAASYNRGGLKNGETFDITSPVIAGYTASETVVSGTIYNRDIKVTVIYTADGVNLDDYGVPLGLGNITMNVGDCFE